MKILMVGGGSKPSKALFEEYYKLCDLSIALDSGLDVFIEYNKNLNYVLGDFDSTKVDKKHIERFNFTKFPPEKDYTDSELGLEKAIDLGADEIYLLGMTGGRLDHLMGNIGLVKKSLDKGIKSYIVDEKNILTIVDKSATIKNKDKKYISFYAYGGEVSNLSIRGAKYDLSNYNLKPYEGICNSNEFKNHEINVTFEKGNLIIIYSRD